MLNAETISRFPYREDIREIYSKERQTVKPYYDLWNDAYQTAAEHFQLEHDGTMRATSETPWKMEKITYQEAQEIGPIKGFIIMGPQDVGKTAIKQQLHEQYGYATVPNYITRQLRPGETQGIDGIHVSEDELLAMHMENELLSVSEQRHSTTEKPYKSGFSKPLFLDVLRGQQTFYIEKSIKGWAQVKNKLLMDKELSKNELNSMRVIFLLPPAPHILALRAINRTLDHLDQPLGKALEKHQRDKVYTEFERALGKYHLIPESLHVPNTTYIVSDNVSRVAQKIHGLTKLQ